MTFQLKTSRIWMIFAAATLLLSCASDVNKNLEEARFLLDKGEYAAAETSCRAALAEDPSNHDGKFLLASSLIGQAFLANGRSYLGLMSNVEKDKKSGESDFETFARIAPELAGDTLKNIQDARDVLISIPKDIRTVDDYLQLYVTRLFEIATVNSQIGATSADKLCNADHASPNKDGVPDDFDPSALSGSAATRFEDNVSNINSDGRHAGLPSSFALNDRLTNVSTDLAKEITAAGGDAQVGAQNYLAKQFCNGLTVCDTSLCVVPK